jgi:hypothetical protein
MEVWKSRDPAYFGKFLIIKSFVMKFKPLVIWIWNQNIAISTIVGT